MPFINKKAFPLPLEVKFLDGRMWDLLKPFKYISEKLGVFTVPIPFRFDFASIPKIFWSIIGDPTGRYGPAALLHDYLCASGIVPRHIADLVFLHAMKDCGVNWFKRWVMYRAVRCLSLGIKIKGFFFK